jgi:acetamidase/formamidase
VLPEHRAVLAGVAPGEGPHFMTGPIAVEGALPGDELVVEVLAMELAQDWGWNRFAVGMDTLPEHFPQARCIHIGIDRTGGTVTMPWGLPRRSSASSASRRRRPWDP